MSISKITIGVPPSKSVSGVGSSQDNDCRDWHAPLLKASKAATSTPRSRLKNPITAKIFISLIPNDFKYSTCKFGTPELHNQISG